MHGEICIARHPLNFLISPVACLCIVFHGLFLESLCWIYPSLSYKFPFCFHRVQHISEMFCPSQTSAAFWVALTAKLRNSSILAKKRKNLFLNVKLKIMYKMWGIHGSDYEDGILHENNVSVKLELQKAKWEGKMGQLYWHCLWYWRRGGNSMIIICFHWIGSRSLLPLSWNIW